MMILFIWSINEKETVKLLFHRQEVLTWAADRFRTGNSDHGCPSIFKKTSVKKIIGLVLTWGLQGKVSLFP